MNEPPSPSIKIFLLDDHPAVREGLSILLTRFGLSICGQAGSRQEALQQLTGLAPDLVLVDLSLGADNGLDFIKDLHTTGIKSLVYSMHEDFRHIQGALSVGAQGYVTKREMTDVLKEAISAVLADRIYLSPIAAEALRSATPIDREQYLVSLLSKRERQIFHFISQGYSTTDIADELKLAVSTVETNLARMIVKLGFTGTKEMRRWAIRHHQETTSTP